MSRMISLAGQDFALRYTVNAICCLEEKMEKGLDMLMKTNFSSLRGLLWCGLMETGVTLEEAGNLLQNHLSSGGNLHQVSTAIVAALEDAGFFHLPGTQAGMRP